MTVQVTGHFPRRKIKIQRAQIFLKIVVNKIIFRLVNTRQQAVRLYGKRLDQMLLLLISSQ